RSEEADGEPSPQRGHRREDTGGRESRPPRPGLHSVVMAAATPGDDGGKVARPHYVPSAVTPPHTLPWWTRFERRTYLSLAKPLAAPPARRLAQRVPAVGGASRPILSSGPRLRRAGRGAPVPLRSSPPPGARPGFL